MSSTEVFDNERKKRSRDLPFFASNQYQAYLSLTERTLPLGLGTSSTSSESHIA